jgi:glutathione S-transferase
MGTYIFQNEDTQMIKLVSFKICPFVQRVAAALEARNTPYEIEFISLSEPPEWFLDVSPNAQVPILITESGTVLFESDAIVEYLDDINAPLDSDISPEKRALDRAWNYQATKHYLVQCSAMQSADKATLTERSENLGRAFERVEKVLEDGPYFHGECLSSVDISWLPLLHRASIIEKRTNYDFLGNYPKVKSWQKAIMTTGIAEKSVSEDFEEEFSSFYLSDKTYLGKGEDCSNVGGGACGSSSASSGGCCG